MDRFKKLRLVAGLSAFESVAFDKQMYRQLSERVLVEMNGEYVFGLGGQFMERFRALGVSGFEKPEEMPFHVVTTGRRADFAARHISDASVAIMGAITGLEFLHYEKARPVRPELLPGFAMLAQGGDGDKRLFDNMALVAEALAEALVAECGSRAKFQFAYGPRIPAKLPVALSSPIIPHVIRYAGCRAGDVLRLLQRALNDGTLPREDAMLFHYVLPQA